MTSSPVARPSVSTSNGLFRMSSGHTLPITALAYGGARSSANGMEQVLTDRIHLTAGVRNTFLKTVTSRCRKYQIAAR